jgi:DNA-binding transcriptional regulator GbsR (MarR family)
MVSSAEREDWSPLDECERGVIEVFVSVADVLGFPRSLGEIYGFAYISPEPIHLAGVCGRLRMSKGSASQGLRTLRDLGALKPVYVPGDRRDFFEPEIRIRILLHQLLSERLRPHLDRSAGALEELGLATRGPAAGLSAEAIKFRRERVELLGAWRKRVATVLPIVQRILK